MDWLKRPAVHQKPGRGRTAARSTPISRLRRDWWDATAKAGIKRLVARIYSYDDIERSQYQRAERQHYPRWWLDCDQHGCHADNQQQDSAQSQSRVHETRSRERLISIFALAWAVSITSRFYRLPRNAAPKFYSRIAVTAAACASRPGRAYHSGPPPPRRASGPAAFSFSTIVICPRLPSTASAVHPDQLGADAGQFGRSDLFAGVAHGFALGACGRAKIAWAIWIEGYLPPVDGTANQRAVNLGRRRADATPKSSRFPRAGLPS